jgi:general secretion pathway protein H
LRLFTTSANGSRGFTLIELGMVIGILALAALVVVPSIEAAFGVKTREEAGKVAGSIRAMYGESVLSGRTCRLVFDLDNRAYWPECAEGRVRVAGMEESNRGKRVEEEDLSETGTEEQRETRQQLAQRSAFGGYESGLAPKRSLPEEVEISAVWTQHQTEPYEAGTAFLYFWPNGQSERAYIYVSDDESDFTIIVNPMTGRTKVVPEWIDVPDQEMSR